MEVLTLAHPEDLDVPDAPSRRALMLGSRALT
jgi:hypothetical protein